MKNFRTLASILILVAISLTSAIEAQYLTPRFGVGSNSFSGLNGVKYTESFSLNSTPDAVGADTVRLFSQSFKTYITPSDSITDSVVYCWRSIASCYIYDEVIFNFIGSNLGTKRYVRFRNSSGSKAPAANCFVFTTAADSSLTIAAKKRTRITFYFDGAKWVETGKVVQP